MKRLAAVTAVTAVATLGAVAFAMPAHAGIDALKISSEGEAYAIRIEQDIPLPAGSGTIPHVVGDARRSPAGENAHGQAGAPSHMDLVIGGTVAKPHDKAQSLPEPYPTANRLPETECFYPGALVDTKTLYPTDMRSEASGVPPVASAVAKCGAGPVADLHASSATIGTAGSPTAGIGAIVQIGTVVADGLMRPVEGVVRADVSARAQGISILNGVVKIASVIADSSSSTKGEKGTGASLARIAITDMEAGGQKFSISTDKLIVGSTSVGLATPQAEQFFATVNASLKPQGCNIAALTTPDRYPQGFVFSRPQPKITVQPDGTFASSMRAGLLLECDLPESITGQTNFSPERLQMVIGFAFSAVEALDQPGGFGLGDLGTFTTTIDNAPLVFTVSEPPVVGAVAITPSLDAPAATPAPTSAPTVTRPRTRIIGTFHPLASRTRTVLMILGIILFAAMTHVGITRVRRVFEVA